jgi:hypothetical protein
MIRYVLTCLMFILTSMQLVIAQDQPTPQADTKAVEVVKADENPVKADENPIKADENPVKADGDQIADPSVIESKKKQEFEKTQRLEKLRYEHLWIAYALIWLAVFVFIWKTWQKSVAQDRKIDELAQKISQFENKTRKDG